MHQIQRYVYKNRQEKQIPQQFFLLISSFTSDHPVINKCLKTLWDGFSGRAPDLVLCVIVSVILTRNLPGNLRAFSKILLSMLTS